MIAAPGPSAAPDVAAGVGPDIAPGQALGIEDPAPPAPHDNAGSPTAAPVDATGRPLTALFVHAHPDDEASKGSGTMAKLATEGARVVLVCLTGGEAGDVLNPAADTPEARADLGAVRRRELEESCRVLGVSALHWLGYHDSGMPDTEANARADNLWNAPADEALERMVRIVRAERPAVLVTYGDDHSRYPHPDHIRTHELGLAVFTAAADPDRFPDAGEPHQVAKLYYQGFWSRTRVFAMHEWFLETGAESPFAKWFEAGDEGHAETAFTTRVDVAPFVARRRAALLAHRTQVAPDSMWMRVPDEVVAERFPWEEYVLVESHVPTGVEPGELETDLFVGLRAVPVAEAAR
jgi:mycothiol S-conjugate amidase